MLLVVTNCQRGAKLVFGGAYIFCHLLQVTLESQILGVFIVDMVFLPLYCVIIHKISFNILHVHSVNCTYLMKNLHGTREI